MDRLSRIEHEVETLTLMRIATLAADGLLYRDPGCAYDPKDEKRRFTCWTLDVNILVALWKRNLVVMHGMLRFGISAQGMALADKIGKGA
jgi:hypothetical protein